MLEPSLAKNDRLASLLIWTFSVVIFLVVVSLKYIQIEIELPFNPHIFATINAIINGTVAITLLAALSAVKKKQYEKHKKLMLSSMVLSMLFLISYIAHHLLTGDTPYPADAPMRWFYLMVLASHILLAAVILPFILFTTYRGLTSEFRAHKKIAMITWPIWFYVAISGVIVYWFISPYYV
jgi:putative membrane protein